MVRSQAVTGPLAAGSRLSAASATATAVAAGVALDRRLGEPPVEPHPVAAFGRAMTALEGLVWRDGRASGVAFTAVGVVGAAGLGAWAAGQMRRPSSGGPRRWAAVVVTTWVTVAGRGLAEAAGDVGRPLAAGDLDSARRHLPALVGRDPAGLSEAEVVRAVVESVAENTVDAVISPVIWAIGAGAPGALAYRAVNTLDSMVGHRSARYERFGWASARLDDVVNWFPARLGACLVAAVRPHRALPVWRAVRRDAPGHPSPNAGVIEAAFAAALDVHLGGVNRYGSRTEIRPRLGTGRVPVASDIDAAVDLADDVTRALVALALLPTMVVTISRLRARRAPAQHVSAPRAPARGASA